MSEHLSEFELLKIIIMQNTSILAILQIMNDDKLFKNKTIPQIAEMGDFRKLRDELQEMRR